MLFGDLAHGSFGHVYLELLHHALPDIQVPGLGYEVKHSRLCHLSGLASSFESLFNQLKYLVLLVKMLLDEFFVLFLLHEDEFARLLLEVVPVLPLVGCLFAEFLLEFHHGIVFVEELIDASASIVFGADFASLEPHEPLFLVIPLQQLHLVKASLLVPLIVSNVSLLHVASVVIKHVHILELTSGV